MDKALVFPTVQWQLVVRFCRPWILYSIKCGISFVSDVTCSFGPFCLSINAITKAMSLVCSWPQYWSTERPLLTSVIHPFVGTISRLSFGCMHRKMQAKFVPLSLVFFFIPIEIKHATLSAPFKVCQCRYALRRPTKIICKLHNAYTLQNRVS